MLAAITAAVSVACAALVALAGYSGGWILAAAVGVALLALAVGWGQLLELPDPVGTGLLIAGTGAAALVLAGLHPDRSRPLAALSAVIACSVVAAFGHELFRRGPRANLVESITGTVSGQVLAVLAAGWLLLPQTRSGVTGILLAAVAVGATQFAAALPWPHRITAWMGFAFGVIGSAAVTRVIVDASLATAITIGVAVAAVAAGLNRMLAPGTARQRSTGFLAGAAAPVAAAGTVAYAAIRLVMN